MPHTLRSGFLILALVLAAILAGCVYQPTYSGQRVRSARDFEIVETSAKRTLTTREMVHLKQKVEDYLEQEGVTENGDYYVKIFLGEEEGSTGDEWVVVRYTKEPPVRYSVLTTTPIYHDPYYSSLAYDTYPFSGYGFSRFSFQYYDYPYYGYRHYPVSRRPHHGWGHHGDRDRKPDGRHDRDRDDDRDDDRDPPRHGGRPSGALKPSFKPTFIPANVNRSPENAPDPLLNEQDRRKRLPNRINVRSHPRQRTVTPGVPRPGPNGSPDFSVRRQVPQGNPATSRPNFNQQSSQVRPDAAVSRRTAPRHPTQPVREVRRTPVPRQSPAATFKPSAPQVHAAPARTAPPARSESRPAVSPSSSPSRVTEPDSTHQEQDH